MGAPVIETVRAGVQFTPPATASFRRAEADLGRRIDVNSTYRDWNLQLSMYNAWERYVQSGYNPRYKPNHSRAVHPKYSRHTSGEALDSDDWVSDAFNEFMADHGFIRTAANDPTERHHYEYQWWRDNHRNRPSGAVVAKPKPRRKASTMIVFYSVDDDGKTIFALAGTSPGTPANFITSYNQDEANQWMRFTGTDTAIKVSFGRFVELWNMYGSAVSTKEVK